LKDDETEALKCAANAGGGNYYDAESADQLAEGLQEAVNQKVDDPVSNHTFYATKNGEPVDAWIKIIDKNTGKEIRGGRTYQDTAHVYIPNGTYNLTVNPLAGSDIASKSFELTKTDDGISHNTISFDGGKIEVLITNNGEGWDATVRVYNKVTGKVAGSARTYGKNPTIELNNGSYDVVVLPLRIKGAATEYKFENVEVEANATNSIAHDYKTGNLSVGVSTSSGELVDATVNVSSPDSRSYIASGRTYTSESSNPKKFIILPGSYEVIIKTLGKHKGTSKTEKIEIVPGQTSTQLFKID